ncbi:MAG: LacI family DNA-binding transcriptional regulator [Verrucomicrobia bacterium]|nr:LacI family DNA-binding transcriptional regulator [Verrucomicrobiota bacterium]
MRKRAGKTRRMRKVSGSITLADVARIAGVAISTASRALNNPEVVSPGAVQRVKNAVARTGYVPNLLAGSLASNRSKLVATIIPTIAGSVFLPTVSSITEALAAEGYQVMLGQSGYGQSREDDLLAAIISRRPDGIILTGIVHSVEGRRRLSGAGVPIVETWDLTPTPIDMLVGFSHEKVGAAVAEYFHARGSRHPGIISANDPRALLRNHGFCAAAAKLGMDPVPVHLTPAPSTLGEGRVGLKDLLGRGLPLDAVMCGSDLLALGAIFEAQMQNLKVPAQLAVVGFGDLDFSSDTTPSLSTVRIDGEAIGRWASKFILDRIAGRPIGARVIDVGFKIISRGSA